MLRAVRPGQTTEARLLRWSWSGLDAGQLDTYLVSGWQDPRINVPSILIRHALLRRLFGDTFDELMRDELGFAIELNEALRLEAQRTATVIRPELDPAQAAKVREAERVIADREGEYQVRWHDALADRSAAPLSLLELACGSANDYRAFADFGLARFLDYTGIDLNPKNIANARRRFPDVDFRVGNAMDLERPDVSVDVVLASDLFEHLPLEVAARVMGEATRVARHAVIFAFFHMAEVAEHEARPVAAYHWNLLSRARVEEVLASRFSSVTVIPVREWLMHEFGYPHSYNARAHVFIAQHDGR